MSEVQRFFLYMLLFFLGMLLWTEWNKEQGQDIFLRDNITTNSDNGLDNVADTPTFVKQESSSIPSFGKSEKITSNKPVSKHKEINISNEYIDLTISTLGGSIIGSSLKKYNQSDDNNAPYRMFNNDIDSIYYAQSSVTGLDFGEKSLPIFSIVENESTGDKATVILQWESGDGIRLTRTYNLQNYIVNIENNLENNSESTWRGRFFYQLIRKNIDSSSSLIGTNSYFGASISDSSKKLYEKITFDDMQKTNLDRKVSGGWIAMQEHYFLTAFIPMKHTINNFFSRDYANGLFAIGVSSLEDEVVKNNSITNNMSLYVGPEVIEELDKIAPGLSMTVDYGILTPISSFIFWLMKMLYDFVGNWGWSIILVTLLIKLAFYKLSASSYRSMANMKKIQPMLDDLKQRYADDKQKLSQETMAMYKREKINPLGGCLPILIQLPVFIGLYWVLLESVELRQSPFIFWIHDLSSKDPYYILPIIMGASWFIQQKLTPAPADPVQAKVMLFMPLVFTVMFLNMPSGLVLYWFINNVLSIIQQWYITRSFKNAQ